MITILLYWKLAHTIESHLFLRTSLGRRPFDPWGVTQLIRLRRRLRFSVYSDKRQTRAARALCERHRKPEKCRDGPVLPRLWCRQICGSILHSTWSTTRQRSPSSLLSLFSDLLSRFSFAFRKLKRVYATAAAMATRGHIVKHHTAGQLALAFATDLYFVFVLPLSLSSRSKQPLLSNRDARRI